jgi:hypothetical protein
MLKQSMMMRLSTIKPVVIKFRLRGAKSVVPGYITKVS